MTPHPRKSEGSRKIIICLAFSEDLLQASFIRGGGVFWTRPTHPTLDPPTRLLTHPDPPPPLIILWGAFFVNQIEAKALSGLGIPKG